MELMPFIGIMFTAFLMGVALMGALCCIYTRRYWLLIGCSPAMNI